MEKRSNANVTSWEKYLDPSQTNSPLSQRTWSALNRWEKEWLPPKSTENGTVERTAWFATRWHNRKLELVSLIQYLETKEERRPED